MAVSASTDMIYRLSWRPRKDGRVVATAHIVTSDAVVVEATNSMLWAVGKSYESVRTWAAARLIDIELISTATSLKELK